MHQKCHKIYEIYFIFLLQVVKRCLSECVCVFERPHFWKCCFYFIFSWFLFALHSFDHQFFYDHSFFSVYFSFLSRCSGNALEFVGYRDNNKQQLIVFVVSTKRLFSQGSCFKWNCKNLGDAQSHISFLYFHINFLPVFRSAHNLSSPSTSNKLELLSTLPYK